jgi:hypothetical protein
LKVPDSHSIVHNIAQIPFVSTPDLYFTLLNQKGTWSAICWCKGYYCSKTLLLEKVSREVTPICLICPESMFWGMCSALSGLVPSGGLSVSLCVSQLLEEEISCKTSLLPNPPDFCGHSGVLLEAVPNNMHPLNKLNSVANLAFFLLQQVFSKWTIMSREVHF